MDINNKLKSIQSKLHVPKKNYNDFSNYHYRSAEDILDAVKPLLHENDLTLRIDDEVVLIGDRYYIKATCVLHDGEKIITVSAFAREQETKKGMDESQITGSTSSYARKYALNGLFLIDDSRDADTVYNTSEGQKKGHTGQSMASGNDSATSGKLDFNIIATKIDQMTDGEEIDKYKLEVEKNFKMTERQSEALDRIFNTRLEKLYRG
jgi:hypothetical protein